jgi:hypothetical protein
MALNVLLDSAILIDHLTGISAAIWVVIQRSYSSR